MDDLENDYAAGPGEERDDAEEGLESPMGEDAPKRKVEDVEDHDDATPPPPEHFVLQVKRRRFFAQQVDAEGDIGEERDSSKGKKASNGVDHTNGADAKQRNGKLDKGKGRAVNQDTVVEILDDSDDDDAMAAVAGPSSDPYLRGPRTPRVPRDGTDFKGDKYLGSFTVKAFATVSSKNSAKDLFKQSKAVKVERPTVSAATQKRLAEASVRVREREENSIVRLRNNQDKEIGRIVQKDANWMAKAIDLNLARFQACVVDVPKEISSGLTEFSLSVRTYVFRDAFFSHQTAADRSAQKNGSTSKATQLQKDNSVPKVRRPTVINESDDTELEYLLKRRKVAITALLGKLNMKPVASGDGAQKLKSVRSMKKYYDKKNGKSSKQSKQGGASDKAKSKAEDTDDEGADLSKSEVERLLHDGSTKTADLPEMDPPTHFSLELRPYQKQALKWMYDKECGVEAEYEQTKMHPLWAEYTFPPADDVIDLDVPDEPFFYNAFSGELSLTYPKGGSKVPGGILADEMGLGKTIMVAALIHSNYMTVKAASESRTPDPDEDQASDSDELEQDDREESPSALKSASLPNASSNLPPKSRPVTPPTGKRAHGRKAATLVVAPTSLLAQWRDELRRTSKDRLSVLVYNDTKDISHLADELDGGVDVVVVSFGKMGVEYDRWAGDNGKGLAKKPKDGLFAIDWFRVILDEAHNIKSRSTRAAKACYALEGRRRWCLTGTPVVNRPEDLFSLVHFLRAEPYGNWSFFKTFVTLPLQNRDESAGSLIREIMSSLMLRREKSMRDQHNMPIVALPPKKFREKVIRLSKEEQAIYDLVERDSKQQYRAYANEGTVKKNTIAILAIITRMRQACLHPSLLLKAGANKDDPSSGTIRRMVARYIAEGGNQHSVEEILNEMNETVEELQPQCMLCQDICEEPVFFPCEHGACKQCMLTHLADGPATCPACQDEVEYSVNDLLQAVKAAKPEAEVIDLSDDSGAESDGKAMTRKKPLFRARSRSSSASSAASSQPGKPSRPSSRASSSSQSERGDPRHWHDKTDFASSTKIDAVIEHLLRVKEKEPKFHAVVFSQFTTFLDLFQQALGLAKLRFVRLDGSMDRKHREAAVRQFNDKSKHCVFIISLKAGGTGLNLTIANRIYLTDWWWSEPFMLDATCTGRTSADGNEPDKPVEEQAIDRVHRFGQERQVFVYRFRIRNSIEGKIKKIQTRKSKLVNYAYKEDAANLNDMWAGIFDDDDHDDDTDANAEHDNSHDSDDDEDI